MVTRVTVRSKYGNLNGGYIANGSHDGKPVYVKDAKTGDVQTHIFHESRFGGSFWYFGPHIPTGRTIRSFVTSLADAASPDGAPWPEDEFEAIEDATHAVDHSRDEAALFHDPEFPHNCSSIGALSSRAGDDFTPQWIAVRFLRRGRWKLFDGIEASDLLQGALGNCWFVAALAAMAEFPREVQKIFVDAQDISRGGRYTIRLFDHNADRIRDVVIDEFIPCHPKSWWDPYGVPLFAKPNGSEAWVLLLEKAMAKMFGSYSALDGNNAAVAFRALTGEKNTYMWKKDREGLWTRWMLSDRSTAFHCDAMRPEQRGDDELFASLMHYDKSNYLMSVSMKVQHAREHKRKDGLVEGHAYSLLQVVEKEDQKLLCMRNPWGDHVQWKGAWSDGDAMWRRFPRLQADLRPEFKEDGMFWMSWIDFKTRWDSVVVCAKTMREGEAAKAHAYSTEIGVGDPGLSSAHSHHPGRLPPPLGSMRLPAMGSEPLNCPGKHGLAHYQGFFDCDLCRRSTGTVKADVYGCRICDHDVCARCVSRSPGGYVKASAASPAADPGTDPVPGTDPARRRKTVPASFPTVAEEPISGEISCPGKHDLTPDTILRKGFTCDLCRKLMHTGDRAWSCRICDFDVCAECSEGDPSKEASGKGHGKGKGEVAGKGGGYPEAADKRPCANGCGRPAFGSFPTCCNRCQGKAGPHAMDCAAKAGIAATTGDPVEASDDAPRIADVGLDPAVLKFDSIRVPSAVTGDMNPCRSGCGRPAFGKYPTCCTRCKGPDGPHARDCEIKAGLADPIS